MTPKKTTTKKDRSRNKREEEARESSAFALHSPSLLLLDEERRALLDRVGRAVRGNWRKRIEERGRKRKVSEREED
jgi:hypothetical protein